MMIEFVFCTISIYLC